MLYIINYINIKLEIIEFSDICIHLHLFGLLITITLVNR